MDGFDKECLDLAIRTARETFEAGNYPVGAVLALDGKILGASSDTGKASKSYINHAEAQLFRDNAHLLLDNGVPRGAITIYSTLEPCLMCLGTAVMCKTKRIIYIQSDPHGGACGISREHLGGRYQQTWPEITKVDYSGEPKELITQYLQEQIKQGIRVEWSEKFLEQIAAS